MARHRSRLIFWSLLGVASLLLLALLAFATLWWFIDPDDYRAQIEARATAAIGRPVRLTGALRWRLGRQIFIASEGGEIANAAGFGPEPLARWSGIRLGVAARPLLDKRVLIDRIEIDGLELLLQRDAQGEVNWALQLAEATGDAAGQSVTVRIAAAELRNGYVRYQDAASGADWRVSELQFTTQLPEDLAAANRTFREIDLSGRLAGGKLPAAGVAFAMQTGLLQWTPQLLQIPAFQLRWADATLGGGMAAQLGGEPDVTAQLELQAPSLRALLATAGVKPPPMADPSTLGTLQFSTALRYAQGAATLDPLTITLDDTRATGKLSLPALEPLSLRFDLAADRVDLDRYLEPDDIQSEPFELPLAELKALDAKGVLRIQQASVAGAAARAVTIDVD